MKSQLQALDSLGLTVLYPDDVGMTQAAEIAVRISSAILCSFKSAMRTGSKGASFRSMYHTILLSLRAVAMIAFAVLLSFFKIVAPQIVPWGNRSHLSR
jgi:hypothetical protein